MQIYCGIDLGNKAHHVCLLNGKGQRIQRLVVSNDLSGLADFGTAIRRWSSRRSEVRIALEDPTTLFAVALVRARYQVTPISPITAARYRQTYRPAGSKSDRTDAFDLANMLRVETGRMHLVYGDSEQVLAIRALSRAQQSDMRLRGDLQNSLRNLLATFYPAALVAFPDLLHLDARVSLRLLPTPAAARSTRVTRLEDALRAAGRQRGIANRAERITTTLRSRALHQPTSVERVKGLQVIGLLDLLDAEQAVEEATIAEMLALYADHPLNKIMTSFPSLSGLLGARILGELGDAPARLASVHAVRALAGTCPITRKSGDSLFTVNRRRRYNRRLGNALNLWSLQLRKQSPAAAADYDRRRELGDRHNTAVRHLMNRYVGILAHCLFNEEPYDEDKVAMSASTPAPTRRSSSSRTDA